MVKVSFSSALAVKDVKKDAESLIPEETIRVLEREQVVVGGAYLYRFYILEVSNQPQQWWEPEEGQVFVCGVGYREEDFMIQEEDEEIEVQLPNQFQLRQLEEFGEGDPADIVHDFQRRLTAYLDLSLNKCYVIPLNTSIVMPPRDFLELLSNVKAGTYLPQSYLIHEEMIVTERLEHVDQLGYFIYNLCRGKDTFKLQRRDRILGMQKREALNCRNIRHFESEFVVETLICEP
uniref:Integral membrane protein 2 n=1 Tax=Anoplopoma fimbria TaxID=229290 RepID=C3KJN1_ANOFI|nr:Integral membrane protein 2B [Anoplopoma fimbria]